MSDFLNPVQKQVIISKLNTMADSSLRITIDVIGANAQDIANLYAYKIGEVDTTMIITDTRVFDEVNQQRDAE